MTQDQQPDTEKKPTRVRRIFRSVADNFKNYLLGAGITYIAALGVGGLAYVGNMVINTPFADARNSLKSSKMNLVFDNDMDMYYVDKIGFCENGVFYYKGERYDPATSTCKGWDLDANAPINLVKTDAEWNDALFDAFGAMDKAFTAKTDAPPPAWMARFKTGLIRYILPESTAAPATP